MDKLKKEQVVEKAIWIYLFMKRKTDYTPDKIIDMITCHYGKLYKRAIELAIYKIK
jgi:hypothetical protein